MQPNWQPNCSRDMLQTRADLYDQIRAFFAARNVLAVETPIRCPHTVTDIHIDSIPADGAYLQTSPEFAMKRLLADGSGCIYQITKAFRQEEVGHQHQPEFTMLEWYRLGFDDHQLMDETIALLAAVHPTSGPASKISYQDLFETHVGINPHTVDLGTAQHIANQLSDIPQDAISTITDCLQLIMSYQIEPTLIEPTIVYDYPAAQCALARLKQTSDGPVSARFELYLGGLEIANGYHELTDAAEQHHRFEADVAYRHAHDKPTITPDPNLLAALAYGLPDCAGIALGLDRLLMNITGAKTIQEVLPFPAS